MKTVKACIVFIFSVLVITGCNKETGTTNIIDPVDLQCERRTDPMGIDLPSPRLSWRLESEKFNEFQTAYHLLVSSSPSLLENETGDLWDSKKVFSGESIHIPYEGKKLETGARCYWKVKVWDKDGNESDWSETASWSMAVMNKADWKAKWIGYDKTEAQSTSNPEHTKLPARYLRKEFSPESEIKRATVYMSGLGLSELYLNGEKVGDYVLSPGQTQFDKRCLYVSYDVTDKIHKGENAIGVILGNGRYYPMRYTVPMDMVGFGFPKLFFQMKIEMTDGSEMLVISDESWKLTTRGPIRENNEFDGEKYDARMEMPGWNMNGFNDSGWISAELTSAPADLLSSEINEPIRITEEIKPQSIKELEPGVFIMDMGQNMVGWVALELEAEKGTRIKMRFAEALRDDGSLYLDNIRSAEVTDIYTCKGNGTESWEPRFTYHGFRYVEVTGFPGTPSADNFTGKVIHDDIKRTGFFNCSQDIINSIFNNGVWGIRGNYRSFPTDCPQRDERMPWLGDRAAGSKGESYIFDISKLYAKWLRDIGDSQLESGSISDVSPSYWKLFNDNVTWNGTPIMLADMLLRQYADTIIIRDSYDYMKKWYDYMMEKYYDNGIMPRDSYGDWCIPPEEPELIHSQDPDRTTSGIFLGTAFFIHLSELMEKFAVILEKEEDMQYFENIGDEMKKAFNRDFFNDQFITYVNNSATSNVLALAFNLVPDEFREKIVTNLVEKIEIQHNGHIPVGLVGAQFIMRILSSEGYPELALRFATQTDYPSWGYMVEQGATTIWELWNGNTADPAMNSRNHVMLLGDLNTWLFENLAGIKPLKAGFREIEMKPLVMDGLDYVDASHFSPYGQIESHWRKEGKDIEWNIEIPVNSSAIVHIPSSGIRNISINGKKPGNYAEVLSRFDAGGYSIVRLGSGKYKLISRNIPAAISKTSERVVAPGIQLSANSSPSPVTAVISSNDPEAEIRYTLDGSEPGPKSLLYKDTLVISETSNLVVTAFRNGKEPSFSRSENIDIYSEKENGLNYSYYEGTWNMLPEFSKLKIKSSGKLNTIENFRSLKQREDYWGIVLEGYIKIDKDGLYGFSIASDDGSKLIIDGKTIIVNDGIHGVMEKQGNIELKAGLLPIKIEFFEGNYGEDLVLSYEGPGIPRQVVPRSMLFYTN